MFALSHASPVATSQSCMSWHRFGVTNETVSAFGTFVKSIHGACLRANFPFVQPV